MKFLIKMLFAIVIIILVVSGISHAFDIELPEIKNPFSTETESELISDETPSGDQTLDDVSCKHTYQGGICSKCGDVWKPSSTESEDTEAPGISYLECDHDFSSSSHDLEICSVCGAGRACSGTWSARADFVLPSETLVISTPFVSNGFAYTKITLYPNGSSVWYENDGDTLDKVYVDGSWTYGYNYITFDNYVVLSPDACTYFVENYYYTGEA